MPLIVRALLLVFVLLSLGCAERVDSNARNLQWTDRQRVVRVELVRDRLRVVGVKDADAVRRALPVADTVRIDGGAAVIHFPEASADLLASHARRLSELGEVQAAVVGDDSGWLSHQVVVALGGRDPATLAARHGVTLVARPDYAPDHAIFACDPTVLTSAVAVALAMVGAGDVTEAVPSILRLPRTR